MSSWRVLACLILLSAPASAGPAPRRATVPAVPALPAAVSAPALTREPRLGAPALGTPGVYSPVFHREITNPRIKTDIEAGRFASFTVERGRLQRAASGEALPEPTLRLLESRAAELGELGAEFDGAQLWLVSAQPGGSAAAHPHLLAATPHDYQVAHAGSNRDESGRPRGRFAYLTSELFLDAAPQPLRSLLAAQLARAGERRAALARGEPAPAHGFGREQLAALEGLRPLLRGELERRPPLARPPLWSPSSAALKPLAAALNLVNRGWRALTRSREHERVPWIFDEREKGYYYHGETLHDLMRIVESGGLMKPHVSQYSLAGRDSVMYAGTRQHNLGLPAEKNPIVMYRFAVDAIAPLVSNRMFQPALMAMDRGAPPVHASYAAAEQPVPLSSMTEDSKDGLIGWVELQRARHPEDPRWDEFLPQLKTALGR